jgi:hypothetical protein
VDKAFHGPPAKRISTGLRPNSAPNCSTFGKSDFSPTRNSYIALLYLFKPLSHLPEQIRLYFLAFVSYIAGEAAISILGTRVAIRMSAYD